MLSSIVHLCLPQSKTFMLWKEIWLQITLVTSFIAQFQLFIFKWISRAKWRYSNLAIFLVVFESCKCSALYFQTLFYMKCDNTVTAPFSKMLLLTKGSKWLQFNCMFEKINGGATSICTNFWLHKIFDKSRRIFKRILRSNRTNIF